MKALNSIIVFLLLIVFINKQVHAQEEFSSLDELNTYIFQKTDLKQVTKG
jgi:hypothetical protein